MSARSFEVYVNTIPLGDRADSAPDDESRFRERLTSIEIIPPISSELAARVCAALTSQLAKDVGLDPETLLKNATISASEFADKGATVNTLISLGGRSIGVEGSKEEINVSKQEIAKIVENILSPSGRAIAIAKTT